MRERSFLLSKKRGDGMNNISALIFSLVMAGIQIGVVVLIVKKIKEWWQN